MFIYNPFQTLDTAAKRMYPAIKTEIQFNPTIKCASTIIKDGVGYIDIPTSITIENAIGALIHELAHVAVNDAENHKAEFNNAIMKISEQYNFMASDIVKNYKQI